MNRLVYRLTLEHQLDPPTYTASALPLAMALATAVRPLIVTQFRSLPAWPYDDRVFVWLLPNFREDVERFHSNRGPALCEMFHRGQLEAIDRACVLLLGARIERLAPGIIRELKRWAARSAPDWPTAA